MLNPTLRQIKDLIDKGDEVLAKAEILQFLAGNPESADAWWLVSLLAGDKDDEKLALQKALTLDGTHYEARRGLERLEKAAKQVIQTITPSLDKSAVVAPAATTASTATTTSAAQSARARQDSRARNRPSTGQTQAQKQTPKPTTPTPSSPPTTAPIATGMQASPIVAEFPAMTAALQVYLRHDWEVKEYKSRQITL
jgi:hypothetical protein